MFMALPSNVSARGERLFGCPPAVDRQIGTSDLARRVGTQEDRQRRNLLDRDELLRWLSLQQDILDDLFARQTARLHGLRDLLLDERCPDIAGTYAVHRDA